MKKRICAMLLAGMMICLAACGKEETTTFEDAIQETETETVDVSEIEVVTDATETNVADDASNASSSIPVSTDFYFESCTDEYQSDSLIIHISKDVVDSIINNDWVWIFASDYTPLYSLEVHEGVSNDFYSGEGAPDVSSNPDANVWCSLKYLDNGDFDKTLGTIYSGNTSTSIKDGYYSFYIRLSNRKFGINTDKIYGDLIIQESSGEKSAKVTPATDIPEGFIYYYEHIDSDITSEDAANDFGYDLPESDFYVYANEDSDGFTSHSGHFIYTPEDIWAFGTLLVEMNNIDYNLILDMTSVSCVVKEKFGNKEYTIPSDQIKIEGNTIDIFVDIPKEDEVFDLFAPQEYTVSQFNGAAFSSEPIFSSHYQASTSDPENSVMVIVEK